MPEKVIMPQLGESVVEGTLIKWLVMEGDQVNEFDSLMEVESAKVNTEIPSPASGTLLRILVEEGTTVKAGTILGWIGTTDEKIPSDGESYVDLKKAESKDESQVKVSDSFSRPEIGRDKDLGFISPVVAKLARENNIELSIIKGTGNNNRITKKDVLQYLQTRGNDTFETETAAWETPGEGDLFRPTELQFPDRFKTIQKDTPKDTKVPETSSSSIPGSTTDTLIPLTKMRKAIAAHMVLSKHTSPHVTTVMEADMKNVSNHLQENKETFLKQGMRLTYTAYFVAVTAAALRNYPMVNSTWTENGILLKRSINIGLATSLDQEGLIVPVIKSADGYSLSGLARIITDLVTRARSHLLKPDDVQDGTFSITNHGTAGSLFATPVINQPQAGILGIGAIKNRVVAINDAIAVRPMVYLSFTFDHRILDGSTADNFLAFIVSSLENWH